MPFYLLPLLPFPLLQVVLDQWFNQLDKMQLPLHLVLLSLDLLGKDQRIQGPGTGTSFASDTFASGTVTRSRSANGYAAGSMGSRLMGYSMGAFTWANSTAFPSAAGETACAIVASSVTDAPALYICYLLYATFISSSRDGANESRSRST